MPDDDRQWVIDAAKTVPGVRDAYHLVDPNTCNGLSIAFFDDAVDVAEVKRVRTSGSAILGSWTSGEATRGRESPGIAPEEDSASATQLECDGEIFELRRDQFGGTQYTWLTGPNAGYGFGTSPSPDDIDQHEANIRSFLAMIDPETGFIED
jgi:hypothetical protein